MAVFAALILLSLVVRGLYLPSPYEHFVYLANAFNHGSLAVDNLPPSFPDHLTVNGHIYTPLGPFPALVLMPIVAVAGLAFNEFWAAAGLTVLNGWLLWRMLARLGLQDAKTRAWLVVLFIFGTIYFSSLLVGISWHLSHILTITCLLLAIVESLGGRRPLLIGMCLGAAFLTRATALFALPYFLYLFWRERRLVLPVLVRLALGLAPALLFYGWYNYARFGSPLETGYGQAVVGSSALSAALQFGLFSPVHIPKHLYLLLLATPQPVPGWDAPALQFPYIQPSPWGMGIFFTTPAFLFAFKADRRQPVVAAAWLGVIAVLSPLFIYYGTGWVQFGYRYALDAYPFLFIPTALGVIGQFSRKTVAVIILCVLINLWGAVWSVVNILA